MTETKLMKLAVRKFILDKMREATTLELGDLAMKHNLSLLFLFQPPKFSLNLSNHKKAKTSWMWLVEQGLSQGISRL